MKAANDNAPRHAGLAEQLAPIREWFNLEATAEQVDDKPSWMGEPANDNEFTEDGGFGADLRREIRPTVSETMRAAEAEGGPSSIDRDDDGNIVRAGGLYFRCDGTLKEFWTPNGRRPAREDLRGERGAAQPKRSVAHLRKILGGDVALPSAGGATAEIFMGGKIAGHPDKHPPQGEDREAREIGRIWAAMLAERVRTSMSPATATTLDALERAATLADVGRSHGYKGKTAERQGKTKLVAAADELAGLMRDEANAA